MRCRSPQTVALLVLRFIRAPAMISVDKHEAEKASFRWSRLTIIHRLRVGAVTRQEEFS